MKTQFNPRLQILTLINASQITDPETRHALVEKFFADVREQEMPLLAISRFVEFAVSDGFFTVNKKNHQVKGNAHIRTFFYFDVTGRECISVMVKTQGDENIFLDFTYSLPEGCYIKALDSVLG